MRRDQNRWWTSENRKKLRKSSDVAKTSTKKSTETRDVPKKLSGVTRETTITDMVQRTAAIQWASEKTSDVNAVTQSTVGKSSGRQKSVKLPFVKVIATTAEDKKSFESQEFIA